MREFYVLDLTALPGVPSLFDDEMRHYRQSLIFLHSFLKDIAKPIQKDGREHIEYVPTQVMTEYFQHIFKFNDAKKLDGMYYPSSRSDSGYSCVLFFNSRNCILDKADDNGLYEKTLSMVSGSVNHKKYN
jgi:hypothetical protein